jgi:hypothetical protein
MCRLALVLAVTLAAGQAAAHVAPSVDDNNRYLKLTPLGDRVRLAYTVFYGEVPGAAMRQQLDANHDGTIDDAESSAFGEKLAAEVAASIDLSVDGASQKVVWAQVVVGMGTPAVRAGTFSIDLIAWLCLPVARGPHQIFLKDRFRLSRPGETELKVEDSPGVHIDHARIGAADDPSFDYKFVGPGGQLADDGLDLAFTATGKAAVTPDTICQAADVPRGLPKGLIVASAAILAFGLAALVTWLRRHKRR